jgi:hypothetical protein
LGIRIGPWSSASGIATMIGMAISNIIAISIIITTAATLHAKDFVFHYVIDRGEERWRCFCSPHGRALCSLGNTGGCC